MKVEIDKDILFKFIQSHSRLSQREYDRNPGYNNSHFSHVAEVSIIKELEESGLWQDYLDFSMEKKKDV